MHEILVNPSGGLSLPRKSVARLTDRPDMTLDVNSGHKTTTKQQQHLELPDRGSPTEEPDLDRCLMDHQGVRLHVLTAITKGNSCEFLFVFIG